MANNSEALALQYLLSQQSLETIPQVAVVSPAPARVYQLSKVKLPKALKSIPAEKVETVTEPVVVPSKAGSIGANGFMKLYRSAKNRQEVIEAIDLYIGYDPRGNFAGQDYLARQKATQEINPNRLTQGVKATASVKGFIAGLPNSKEKHRENLLARERMAADAMIQHEKTASELPYGSSERALHEGLAKVECDRLQEIRHDLKQLG